MSRAEMAEHKDFLYIRLADQILQYIRENHLKTGERIPAERKLAELFNTSRASVREAVRILENKGIIEIQVGNGMFLRSGEIEQNYQIELWKIDYTELLEVKTLLEFHIIEELCRSITEPELRSLEEPLMKLERDYEMGAFSMQDDNVFHNRLRRLCHNQTLVQLIDSLIAKLDTYGSHIKGVEHIWLTTIPYHRDLLEAIRQHDVEKARLAYGKINELDRTGLKLPVGS